MRGFGNLRIDLKALDKLDIRILRGLTQGLTVFSMRPGVKLSFRAIARDLAVSEGTVRKRIEGMSSSGLIAGETVFLNPSLLGLTWGAYGLDVSPAIPKKQVIERLKLIEGVIIIQNHHGSFMGIIFVYENEGQLRKKLELFNSIAGAKEGIFSVMPFPPGNISLSPFDWKVISYLVRGQYRSYEHLASQLHVSTRTFRRKISKMVKAGAIFTIPIVDYREIKGAVPADLLVLYKTPESRAEAEGRVLQLVNDFMFYAGIWKDEGFYNLILPNALTATELSERAAQIEGVAMARMELVDEHIDQSQILSNYVSRRINLIKELSQGA